MTAQDREFPNSFHPQQIGRFDATLTDHPGDLLLIPAANLQGKATNGGIVVTLPGNVSRDPTKMGGYDSGYTTRYQFQTYLVRKHASGDQADFLGYLEWSFDVVRGQTGITMPKPANPIWHAGVVDQKVLGTAAQ